MLRVHTRRFALGVALIAQVPFRIKGNVVVWELCFTFHLEFLQSLLDFRELKFLIWTTWASRIIQGVYFWLKDFLQVSLNSLSYISFRRNYLIFKLLLQFVFYFHVLLLNKLAFHFAKIKVGTILNNNFIFLASRQVVVALIWLLHEVSVLLFKLEPDHVELGLWGPIKRVINSLQPKNMAEHKLKDILGSLHLVELGKILGDLDLAQQVAWRHFLHVERLNLW